MGSKKKAEWGKRDFKTACAKMLNEIHEHEELRVKLESKIKDLSQSLLDSRAVADEMTRRHDRLHKEWRIVKVEREKYLREFKCLVGDYARTEIDLQMAEEKIETMRQDLARCTDDLTTALSQIAVLEYTIRVLKGEEF
jgi:chromosome segregation ATPase